MDRLTLSTRTACALLTLLLAPSPGLASEPSSHDAALDAIAAYAPRAMREQGTPGLSIAITDSTRTLRVITLGYSDTAAQKPVTAQTRFAIGSITKSMTALELLQLTDAGKLDLQAPVTKYLPWFSIHSNGVPVLVHQLLSHTGGIPDDYAFSPGYVDNIFALRNARTLYTPGTAWSYSNDGYETAGAILAQLDGRTWPDAVRSRVFDPMGMTDSSPVFTPDALSTAALGYQFRDNDRPPSLRPALAASPAFDFVDPAGSVLSTPEDMARYMRFYLDGGRSSNGKQLLRPATFAAMTAADRLKNGKPGGSAGVELSEAPAFYKQYGYGLSVFDEGGDRVVGHTGGISGYTACMQMNLTRGFGVIAFANLVEAPLHPCAIVLYAMRALRAAAAGEPIPAAPPPPPDPARVERAADYAGTYAGASGSSLQVAADGDRLSLIDAGKTIALYSRGSGTFWADDAKYATFLLAFGRDRNRKVVDLTYGGRWWTNEQYRGPKTFAHPPAWDALAGRYEKTFFGEDEITRVVVVKDRLTLDGVDTLKPLPDGAFALGTSVIRFKDFAGSRPQRLRFDSADLYRVELP
jgi:CubicO group peptidase (beta-lactamase class C family)